MKKSLLVMGCLATMSLVFVVYGQNGGDPCNGANADNLCDMAWRWNLDYALDTSGNEISYFYNQYSQYYDGGGWRGTWKLDGKKFRRQHSIGPYIVDFFCPECRLAVELDGDAHMTGSGAEADERRTKVLKHFNVRVIRFENKEVFDNLEGVIAEIRRNL